MFEKRILSRFLGGLQCFDNFWPSQFFLGWNMRCFPLVCCTMGPQQGMFYCIFRWNFAVSIIWDNIYSLKVSLRTRPFSLITSDTSIYMDVSTWYPLWPPYLCELLVRSATNLWESGRNRGAEQIKEGDHNKQSAQFHPITQIFF